MHIKTPSPFDVSVANDPEPLFGCSPPLVYQLMKRFLACEEEKKVCLPQRGRFKVIGTAVKQYRGAYIEAIDIYQDPPGVLTLFERVLFPH